jgi:hypothetical protein
MAQINRISSFKTFSEIKATQAATQLAEENAAKRSELTSKISSILDDMNITSLENLEEDVRKELISRAFGEISEETEEESIPKVAEEEVEETEEVEESLINEAVIVTGKRDAKKVLTAYTKFFERYPALADRRLAGLHLGSIKALMVSALVDANFHREAPVCGKAIKGAKIQPLYIKPIELNKSEIKIPVGRVMSILDDNASIISGAAGFSGLGIAEGTALYLESIKATKIAEDVITAFSSTFESEVTEITEGNAFLGARAKAIEEDAEEFEFNGKTYPVVKENSLVSEGTRGQFGKIDKKGNISSIYTHYDSYPENMLPIIKKTFKAGKNVDDVIAKGACSGLDANLSKINFYDDGSEATTGSVKKIDQYLRSAADDGGAEYVYLWDEGSRTWMMADIYGDMELVPAFESVVTEAKFVKDFNRDVLEAKTKEEVLKLYPKATFFVGKSDHFFGELDDNLFFKAYYTKAQEEFEIKSVYSEKGSNYVHLYNESEVKEGNAFGDAVRKAKEAGEKEFEFEGETYKVEEGNAFGDAVRKAKEAGEKEFEFEGETYKVEEAEEVTEAEVTSDEEFKEYATAVLQKAFGEDYDEAKAGEVIDGILSKCGDDYGACVGTLTSSLG